MAKDEMSYSVLAGGQGMSGEAREGRHAEVEALVALGLEMLHQPHEKEVHRRAGRVWQTRRPCLLMADFVEKLGILNR